MIPWLLLALFSVLDFVVLKPMLYPRDVLPIGRPVADGIPLSTFDAKGLT